MKRWSWLLLAALLAAPAVADDKKKKEEDKKAKAAPAAQAPVAQDAVTEAEAKLAAGDAEAAIEVLQKAAGVDPKAALRLGRSSVLECWSGFDSRRTHKVAAWLQRAEV